MKFHNPDQIYTVAVEALDGFDPKSECTELYISDFLDGRNDMTRTDRDNVIDIFCDCVQYSRTLKVLVDAFLNSDGLAFKRSQYNMYRVIGYLTFFKLSELGTKKLYEFVKTRELRKMYRFLNFCLKEDHINGWIRQEWCLVYTTEHVDDVLLKPVLQHLPELQNMLVQMKRKMDALEHELDKDAEFHSKKPLTQSRPFNITEPRPKSVPVPQMIPTVAKPKPIPKTNYQQPKEKSAIEASKVKNRRRAEEILLEASTQGFACSNANHSEKVMRRLDQIIEEEQKQLQFSRHKANPLPLSTTEEVTPVRLNATTILREEKLYKKQEAKELAKLRQLEEGFGNASEFLQWQQSMRRMDEQEQLIAIEKRRLAGKLSYEEAILARSRLAEDKQKAADEMRDEARYLMMQYAKNKLQEDDTIRQKKQTALDIRDSMKEALKEMQKFKSDIVKQVKEENKQLMEQALEEAEKEMQQKMDLIREIRAMEMTPVVRFKPMDPTEIAGHGLMCEMSLTELRARLFGLKQKEQAEMEDKRDDIIAGKQAKEQNLMDALTHISQVRAENTRTAVLQHEVRKKKSEKKIFVEDEQLKSLERQVQERQRQRKKLQATSQLKGGGISAERLRELKMERTRMENSRWYQVEQHQEKMVKLSSRPGQSALARYIMKQTA